MLSIIKFTDDFLICLLHRILALSLCKHSLIMA